MDPQVTDDAFDVVVGEVAIAAVDLQGVVGDLEGGVGDEAFGHGAPAGRVRGLAVESAGGFVEHDAGGLKFGFHVGQLELDALEIGDGLAELLAVLRVSDGLVERELGAAEGAGGDVEAPAIEAGHREAEAVAFLTDPVSCGHAHFVEDDLRRRLTFPAHLAFVGPEGEAGRALLDDEGGDALCSVV